MNEIQSVGLSLAFVGALLFAGVGGFFVSLWLEEEYGVFFLIPLTLELVFIGGIIYLVGGML